MRPADCKESVLQCPLLVIICIGLSWSFGMPIAQNLACTDVAPLAGHVGATP